MKMKLKMCAVSALLAGGLLLTGCDLEERIMWAPSGRQAAVCSGGTLRLCGPNGEWAAGALPGVTAFAWLPDEKGLLYVRETKCSAWSQAVPLMEPAEKDWIEKVARMLLDLVNPGAADNEKRIERSIPKNFPLELGLLYARDTDPQRFRALLRTNDWKEVETMTAPVYELGVVSMENGRLGAPRMLRRSALKMSRPLASPHQKTVAYIRDGQLALIPLTGGISWVRSSMSPVADFDWMPDARSLVVAQTGGMDEPKVNCGMLIQVDVNILEDGLANGGGERVLALTFFGARPTVRVLPGGRVLFAGAELTLPAAGSNLPRMQLFTIDGRGAPVRVPCDPDALPVDAGYFVPSPDGRRVALAEPGSDTVAILSVDSGEVQLISPNRGAKSRTFPAWRGADELFFAALPAAGARRPEMVRWSKGKTDVFSAAWDDAAVADLVEMPAQK